MTALKDKISNIRKDLKKAPISTSQTPQDIFNKFDGEVLDSFTEDFQELQTGLQSVISF